MTFLRRFGFEIGLGSYCSILLLALLALLSSDAGIASRNA